MKGPAWTAGAVSVDALAVPVKSVVWFSLPGSKWNVLPVAVRRTKSPGVPQGSVSLLGSVHVPVGSCVSWGICFLSVSVLAKGQKCCVSRTIRIFVGPLELGRKEMFVRA